MRSLLEIAGKPGIQEKELTGKVLLKKVNGGCRAYSLYNCNIRFKTNFIAKSLPIVSPNLGRLLPCRKSITMGIFVSGTIAIRGSVTGSDSSGREGTRFKNVSFGIRNVATMISALKSLNELKVKTGVFMLQALRPILGPKRDSLTGGLRMRSDEDIRRLTQRR